MYRCPNLIGARVGRTVLRKLTVIDPGPVWRIWTRPHEHQVSPSEFPNGAPFIWGNEATVKKLDKLLLAIDEMQPLADNRIPVA